jgi:hypothetical protein
MFTLSQITALTSSEETKTAEMLSVYNELATALGLKSVNKFADRKTAVRRLNEIVTQANEAGILESEKPTKVTKVKEPKERKSIAVNYLGMRADLYPNGVQQVPTRGATWLKCFELLRAGATEEQLLGVWEGNPKAKTNAYEMTRIFCTRFGWGTRSEDGKIFLITLEEKRNASK